MITTQSHIQVSASELKVGDGLRVGSDNYVLVSEIEQAADQILVSVWHGTEPGDSPEYSIERDSLVQLSARNRKPCDSCDAIIDLTGPSECGRCQSWDRL